MMPPPMTNVSTSRACVSALAGKRIVMAMGSWLLWLAAARQKPQRNAIDRRTRRKRMVPHRRIRLTLASLWIRSLGRRQESAGRHQTLLALARAGAKPCEALDLLDAEITEVKRLLDIVQRHIFAAADHDLVRHGLPKPFRGDRTNAAAVRDGGTHAQAADAAGDL